MTQNTSMAVMQNRKRTKAALDFFPTPPWATRALCERLGGIPALSEMTCWEPACGEGHMSRVLEEYFLDVVSSDCQPYGWDHHVSDFLVPDDKAWASDWVITNPPFKQAEVFALNALSFAMSGVALLVRTAFLEGAGRFHRLFNRRRPALVLQFTERVPMLEGRLDPKASSATAYCWIVWTKMCVASTTFDWLPPCRKELERPEDYLSMGGQNG